MKINWLIWTWSLHQHSDKPYDAYHIYAHNTINLDFCFIVYDVRQWWSNKERAKPSKWIINRVNICYRPNGIEWIKSEMEWFCSWLNSLSKVTHDLAKYHPYIHRVLCKLFAWLSNAIDLHKLIAFESSWARYDILANKSVCCCLDRDTLMISIVLLLILLFI